MHTVIAFDISDDRKRYRVVRLLRDAAVRVQKSVLEATRMEKVRFLRQRGRGNHRPADRQVALSPALRSMRAPSHSNRERAAGARPGRGAGHRRRGVTG